MRPQVRLKDGERTVEWPPNVFSAKRVEHLDRDVILLSGVEPHLAWRSYVEAILDICDRFQVAGVVLLGALLVEQLQGGLQNALAGFHPWLLVQLGAKD